MFKSSSNIVRRIKAGISICQQGNTCSSCALTKNQSRIYPLQHYVQQSDHQFKRFSSFRNFQSPNSDSSQPSLENSKKSKWTNHIQEFFIDLGLDLIFKLLLFPFKVIFLMAGTCITFLYLRSLINFGTTVSW